MEPKDDREQRSFALFWGNEGQDFKTLEMVEMLQLQKEKVTGITQLGLFLIYSALYIALTFTISGDPEHLGMPEAAMRDAFLNEYFGDQLMYNTIKGVKDRTTMWMWLEQVFLKAIWDDGYTDHGIYIKSFNRVVRSPILATYRASNHSAICDQFYKETLSSPYTRCQSQGGGYLTGYDQITTDPFGPPGNPTKYIANRGRQFQAIFRLFDDQVPEICTQCAACCRMTKTLATARAFLSDLKNDSFISRETQWLAIYMDVQNGVSRSFGHMRLVFALEPSGVVIPAVLPFTSWNAGYGTLFFAFTTNRLMGPTEYFIFALEALLAALTFGFLIQTLRKIYYNFANQGFEFSRVPLGFWEIYDALTHTLVLLNCLMHFGAFAIAYQFYRKLPVLDTVDLDSGWYFLVPFNYFISAFCILMFTLRTLRFFHLHPRFSFISKTLSLVVEDLAHYALVLGVIMGGFTMAGWFFWGHGSAKYRSFVESLQSVLSFSLGNFDIDALRSIDTSFSIMLFTFYFVLMFLIFFVLVNIFLAIIITGYNRAREIQNMVALRTPERTWRMTFMPFITRSYPSDRDVIHRLRHMGIIDKVLPLPRGHAYVRALAGRRLRIKFFAIRETVYPRHCHALPESAPQVHGYLTISIVLPPWIKLTLPQIPIISFFSKNGPVILRDTLIDVYDNTIVLAVPRTFQEQWDTTTNRRRVVIELFQVIEEDMEGLMGSYMVHRTGSGNLAIVPIQDKYNTGPITRHVLGQSFTIIRDPLSAEELLEMRCSVVLQIPQIRALLLDRESDGKVFRPDFVEEVATDLVRRLTLIDEFRDLLIEFQKPPPLPTQMMEKSPGQSEEERSEKETEAVDAMAAALVLLQGTVAKLENSLEQIGSAKLLAGGPGQHRPLAVAESNNFSVSSNVSENRPSTTVQIDEDDDDESEAVEIQTSPSFLLDSQSFPLDPSALGIC